MHFDLLALYVVALIAQSFLVILVDGANSLMDFTLVLHALILRAILYKLSILSVL